MALLGLESITYGTDDLDASRAFLSAFGLGLAEAPARTGATFTTEEGARVELRAQGDASLAPAVEPGGTVRHVCWGVDSAESLDQIASRLDSAGFAVSSSDGRIHTTDPSGQSISFAVSSVQHKDLTTKRRPDNTSVVDYERAAPFHLGHVVFFAPDLAATTNFYMDLLGFRLSDEYVVGDEGHRIGLFLRCDGSTNHHNLFLLSRESPGLNHVSFRVRDVDELMVGRELLESAGHGVVWGPGRHSIGSDLFAYFRNPAGGFIEYHADEDVITDSEAWVPRTFNVETDRLGGWGGPPPHEMMT